jgi:predicted transcriptional regulator
LDKERAEQERVLHTGFIAQEVEQAAKDINFKFDGVHHPENDNDTYSIAYAEFVVPLVKAVQELNEENKKLKEQNTSMQKRLDEIQAQIEMLKQAVNKSNDE